MDKNELLLFIKERLEQINKMSKGQFSGRITRDEQTKYQEAWSYIDPKAKVCFTCGRTPQLKSLALLNYYQCQQENALTESGVTETASTKPKRKRRKRGSQSK